MTNTVNSRSQRHKYQRDDCVTAKLNQIVLSFFAA